MNWLRKVMYGRYGCDQFSLLLLAVYLVLYLLGALLRLRALAWLGFLAAAWDLFRTLSRNIPARRAENDRFLRLAAPPIRWMRMCRTRRRDKEHCYFKCPNCGQYLRVPRGKGKITVTCRRCGVSFEEKS